MNEPLLKVAHAEIISLVNQGVEECTTGDVNVGVSIFLEAQFLLGELIQHQLNKVNSTPPLSPLLEDWPDEGRIQSRRLQTAG